MDGSIMFNIDAIIKLASLMSALVAIGGVVLWIVHFVDRQNRQDKEIAGMRKEQTLICYGVLACLKGLKEQGCNGPVTDALNKIEMYLNQAAHDSDDI